MTFIIPTGAAGHVTAGVLAKLMGLPIAKLVMATNEVKMVVVVVVVVVDVVVVGECVADGGTHGGVLRFFAE